MPSSPSFTSCENIVPSTSWEAESVTSPHTEPTAWLWTFQLPELPKNTFLVFINPIAPGIPLEQNKRIKTPLRFSNSSIPMQGLTYESFAVLILQWANTFSQFLYSSIMDQDGRWPHRRLIWSLFPHMRLSAPFPSWAGQELWTAKRCFLSGHKVAWLLNGTLSNWPSEHDY